MFNPHAEKNPPEKYRIYLYIFRLPQMGVLPNHPFLDRKVHEIYHPAIGVPPFLGNAQKQRNSWIHPHIIYAWIMFIHSNWQTPSSSWLSALRAKLAPRRAMLRARLGRSSSWRIWRIRHHGHWENRGKTEGKPMDLWRKPWENVKT